MKSLRLLLPILLIVSLVLAACAVQTPTDTSEAQKPAEVADPPGDSTETPTDEKLVIGISIRNVENPYYVQIHEAVQMFAEYAGADKFDIQYVACEASDDKQLNDVKALIARGGKNTIIYVDPNNAPVAAAIAKVCEDAGVYWCTAWSYAEGVHPMDFKYYAFHQTPGQVESTKSMMLSMFESFRTPNQGKVLGIKGLPANTASIDRFAGLEAALAEAPGVELLDVQVGNWNPQEALTITNTWLSKYDPDEIDGIWVANDEMALAVIEALKARGYAGKIKVTGFDGIPDAVNAIVAGDLFATVGANPWVQSGLGVAYLYNCWNGTIDTTKLPAEERAFYTEGQVLSSDNIDEYIKNFIDNKPDIDFSNYKSMIFAPMTLN